MSRPADISPKGEKPILSRNALSPKFMKSCEVRELAPEVAKTRVPVTDGSTQTQGMAWKGGPSTEHKALAGGALTRFTEDLYHGEECVRCQAHGVTATLRAQAHGGTALAIAMCPYSEVNAAFAMVVRAPTIWCQACDFSDFTDKSALGQAMYSCRLRCHICEAHRGDLTA